MHKYLPVFSFRPLNNWAGDDWICMENPPTNRQDANNKAGASHKVKVKLKCIVIVFNKLYNKLSTYKNGIHSGL